MPGGVGGDQPVRAAPYPDSPNCIVLSIGTESTLQRASPQAIWDMTVTPCATFSQKIIIVFIRIYNK